MAKLKIRASKTKSDEKIEVAVTVRFEAHYTTQMTREEFERTCKKLDQGEADPDDCSWFSFDQVVNQLEGEITDFEEMSIDLKKTRKVRP